jgi:acyl-CoA synthetase (NDP forming)
MRLFLEPRSVALIGVPRLTGPGSYNGFETMRRYGYPGRIYLVHPKVQEILGQETYPRLAALPETPDLAVISLGRDRVLPVFQDCVARGIKRVVVISQGFADADARGAELQETLVRTAREHGVRIIGPNTLGTLDAFSGFSTAFIDIPREEAPAPLSLVVQSGAFPVGYHNFTGQVGKAIDIGNACDVDFVDCLEFLEGDPQTQIIMLHMEGLKRGREFLKVAARVAPKKPIIVLKTGRSAAGAQAALSHTGALVGEDAIFDLAFQHCGLIRVRNLPELRVVAKALLNFRPMAGPRLGMVTATGAFGIMAADACEDYGLELPPLADSIRLALEDSHIPWHHLHNPVDIWPLGMVSGSFIKVLTKAAKALLQDQEVDGLLAIGPCMTSELHADIDFLAAVREIQAANPRQKPLALALYGDDTPRQYSLLDREPGVACFDTLDEAILGLAATWRWRRLAQALQEGSGDSEAQRAPVSPPLKAGLLLGEEALALLQRYGIPLAPWRLAQQEEEAAAAAEEIGYPVVLKIVSNQWLHKSNLGGVILNLAGVSELRQAYGELRRLFSRRTAGGDLQGILVQKQVKGTELLVGIKQDRQFGPVVVAGMGGIYTETFQDVARTFPPVSRPAAAALLQSLKMYPILEGARGQDGVRLDCLVDLILAVSRLAEDHPEIGEMDLNPVVADKDGCWCVDCRVVVEKRK